MAILTEVLRALVLKTCAEEVHASLPWITDRVFKYAIGRLPLDQREKYTEEWAADLQEYPGPLTRLMRALGLVWAGLSIDSEESLAIYMARAIYFIPKMAPSMFGVTLASGTLAATLGKIDHFHTLRFSSCLILGSAVGLLYSLYLVGGLVFRYIPFGKVGEAIGWKAHRNRTKG